MHRFEDATAGRVRYLEAWLGNRRLSRVTAPERGEKLHRFEDATPGHVRYFETWRGNRRLSRVTARGEGLEFSDYVVRVWGCKNLRFIQGFGGVRMFRV